MYNRIDLPLRPSRSATAAATTPWLLLLASSLVIAALAQPWVALVIPLILAGAVDRWRRQGNLTHSRAVVRLATQGPRLFASLADGTTMEVRPLPESRLCGPWLLLAMQELHGPARMQAVLAAHDRGGNAPSQALRRLRTWLRLMPEPIAPIPLTSARKNPLQRLWTGAKPHD